MVLHKKDPLSFIASAAEQAAAPSIHSEGLRNHFSPSMHTNDYTTLESIHQAAKAEFLKKGVQSASLRNIVKSAGMTTGAFYGYYKSKEDLFEALVGEQYHYILNRFNEAQREFAEFPCEQPDHLHTASGRCMDDILHYAYEHLEEGKLLLCGSQGTRFAWLVDEMVKIEAEGTHAYLAVLKALGRPAPHIDPHLKHILITGMFHIFL